MTRKRFPGATLPLAVLLAACAPQGGPDVTKLIDPSVITATEMSPPADIPGVCWGHEPGPEVTEIVRDIVLATPAQTGPDGGEIAPAIYREVTRPKTFIEGEGRWFTRTCDADLTTDFVATLQRALAARGLYGGKITGEMDARTRSAIRAYQEPQGLASHQLSLSAAQQLGLIAVELPTDTTDAPEQATPT